MNNDPQRTADTRVWLHKASADLRAAELDLTAEDPLRQDALFHCQQASEKALKAFLTWHDEPFRKTHNLVEIGEQCAGKDKELEPLLRRAAVLTEYAWKFRYPGDPEEPGVQETDEALALAREVYEAILARLPQQAGP